MNATTDVKQLAKAAIGKTVASRKEPGVSGVVERCPKTYMYFVRSGNCLYECGSAEALAEGWELINYRELCEALAKRVAELEVVK